jgi:hypothetical protein
MKHIAFSLILPLTVVSMAAADPFSLLAAHGHANYSAYAAITNNSGGSSNSYDLYSGNSLYAGAGDYFSYSETWVASTDVYIGDDEWGNPIYETVYEDQIESATAEAHAYGRFFRGGNVIDSEVYAYAFANYSYSGSYAYASANASAYGQVDVSFTLLTATAVHMTTTTSYGNGYINLSRDGNLVTTSSDLIFGSWDTVLPAGEYAIWGDASDGGANLSIEAVPEPATMAALGLGALGLLRRRRKA